MQETRPRFWDDGVAKQAENTMVRKLWRILVIVGGTLAVIGTGVFWAGPVALSICVAWKAPNRARLVPGELTDISISQATGKKLSYFGYEFEVPWNDINPEEIRLYPKLNPNRAVLAFRSGLQISITVLQPKEMVNGIASAFQLSPQLFERFVGSAFGPEATRSEYAFLGKLYEFTPKKMNRWAIHPSVHYRESMMLTIKSTTLLWSADSGIFNIHSEYYKGYQQGSPQARPNGLVATLYSDDDSIEFIFNQKNYQIPAGISQAEINRVIQSLHKVGGRKSVLLHFRVEHGLPDS